MRITVLLALSMQTPMKLVVLASITAALCTSTSCRPSNSSPPKSVVTVLAAASLGDAMEAVKVEFTKSHPNVEVVISTGPSSGLTQQILNGAPADLFLSANQKLVDDLDKNGFAKQRVDLLSNTLVLITQADRGTRITSLSDLAEQRDLKVAIADANVPAGIYARQALKATRVFATLEKGGRLIQAHDVRAALTYVEQGEAETGIVYATDARASSRVKVVLPIDASLHEPIIYPAVLLRSRTNGANKEFFEFICGESALEVFKAHGFKALDTREQTQHGA